MIRFGLEERSQPDLELEASGVTKGTRGHGGLSAAEHPENFQRHSDTAACGLRVLVFVVFFCRPFSFCPVWLVGMPIRLRLGF